jgi:hypothetical protein
MKGALAMIALLWLPADLTGGWMLDLDPDFGGMRSSVDCTLKQDGSKLAMDCGNGPTIAGELDGRKVTLRVKTGPQNELTATFVGELNEGGTTISGTWQLTDSSGTHKGKFTATKREEVQRSFRACPAFVSKRDCSYI